MNGGRAGASSGDQDCSLGGHAARGRGAAGATVRDDAGENVRALADVLPATGSRASDPTVCPTINLHRRGAGLVTPSAAVAAVGLEPTTRRL